MHNDRMDDAVPPLAPAADDALAAARSATARHAWREAFALFSEADRDDALTAADLEDFSVAAFFAAHADVGAQIKERAFTKREAEGDATRAAYLAIDIARGYGYAGKYAIATAWKRRAERLVGIEGTTYAHGYLALADSEAAGAAGRFDDAIAHAERAIAISRNAEDADLVAYAQMNLGSLKLASGATTDGLALMEEASIAAVNGDLTPFTSGVTACRMIGACRDLTDYRKASEWIEATEKYCDRQALDGFPGVCRIHRAEVAAVGGAWAQAEQELLRATTELAAYNAIQPQADGFYAIGDIRRLRGDLAGAEEALGEAHSLGRSPQPALALVRLAQGKTRAAAAAIDAAVAEQQLDQWARARLLPAQAEIAIAIGRVDRARAIVDELAAIVAGYPSPALIAGCRVAIGRVLVAERDGPAAAAEIRAGLRLWREVGAPYEVARARVVLADALRLVDADDDVVLELRAAAEEFRRLGAVADEQETERALRSAEARRSGPQTARRTFMFTDIVGSTSLAETLGDEVWERLLRWHDDVLRGLVEAGGGQIVNSTGDGFFAAFESSRSALDAAMAIQRALLEHRTASGVALEVRIGLHVADATQRGHDYSGIGVHVAARIGGLGQAGEILASAETLREAGDARAAEATPRPVRGSAVPVAIAAVPWR
jgi:class 3 adenylate cyclase